MIQTAKLEIFFIINFHLFIFCTQFFLSKLSTLPRMASCLSQAAVLMMMIQLVGTQKRRVKVGTATLPFPPLRHNRVLPLFTCPLCVFLFPLIFVLFHCVCVNDMSQTQNPLFTRQRGTGSSSHPRCRCCFSCGLYHVFSCLHRSAPFCFLEGRLFFLFFPLFFWRVVILSEWGYFFFSGRPFYTADSERGKWKEKSLNSRCSFEERN